MRLIVACGLTREASLIARPGGDVTAVAGGGDADRLEAALDALARAGPALILSSGLAGALDPALRAGDVVLDGDATVVAAMRRRLVHPPAANRMAAPLIASIAGSDTILATAAQKRALRAATGAVAVDMESHVARRVAARHGRPFAALRTISDRADESLPPAALIGMRPDGGMAPGAVLASLARHPAQLPALIRTGIGADRAFRALGRAHHALGGLRIELADLGEFRLDMA
ncbi:phosphorylase [Sphingomonas profundi]|uniref:phosphorylase family protein n=1 Tax=Alterirhizorhabdus profundi TaxID=2681549 RepID=UPI0012E8F7B5|nr:phosphorylase [Sphingomonas profundi]